MPSIENRRFHHIHTKSCACIFKGGSYTTSLVATLPSFCHRFISIRAPGRRQKGDLLESPFRQYGNIFTVYSRLILPSLLSEFLLLAVELTNVPAKEECSRFGLLDTVGSRPILHLNCQWWIRPLPILLLSCESHPFLMMLEAFDQLTRHFYLWRSLSYIVLIYL